MLRATPASGRRGIPHDRLRSELIDGLNGGDDDNRYSIDPRASRNADNHRVADNPGISSQVVLIAGDRLVHHVIYHVFGESGSEQSYGIST
jgi:hypothetical protein